MSELNAEIYLGIMRSEGERFHVFADLSYTAENSDHEHETTSHEKTTRIERIAASFTIIEARYGITAKRNSASDFPDRYWVTAGQIPAEDRVILDADRSSKLSAEDLALINDTWERWHLNDMQAGCVHMPSYAELAATVAALPDPPMKYGRPDTTGWALSNVVCPVTGYKWGHSWLYSQPPADVVAKWVALINKATR